MDLEYNNHSNQADSLVIQPAPAKVQIVPISSDFNFSSDAFVVDSSRLVKKPVQPIIKTVPYIPDNDTIQHPTFDVLTGEFVIARDGSLMSQLGVNPIAPMSAISSDNNLIVVQDPSVGQIRKTIVTEQVGDVFVSADQSVVEKDDSLQVVDADSAETIVVDTLLAQTEIQTDTIIADSVAVDTLQTDSTEALVETPKQVFVEREGTPIVRTKIERFSLSENIAETDWMLGIIIVSFAIFAWTRMIYGKFVRQTMQSAVNFYTARRTYEESNAVFSRVSLLLNILFYINASLFTCQCFMQYRESADVEVGLVEFGICAVALFSFYTLRTIVLKVLDFIFETHAFGAYNFSIYIYNKVYGLFLLPLIAAIPFVPQSISDKLTLVGIALFVLLYVCTLFRGLRICIKNRVSIFYLFFYLCTLEILPLMVVYKCILNYCI